MNWLKAGLLVMLAAGVTSVLPRGSAQVDNVIRDSPRHETVDTQYNGWNACRRADGRTVGVVTSTLDNGIESFYLIALANESRVTVTKDANGKPVQSVRPVVARYRASLVYVTRKTCPWDVRQR